MNDWLFDVSGYAVPEAEAPVGDWYDDVVEIREVYEYNGFSTGDMVIRGNGQTGLVEKGGKRKVTVSWSSKGGYLACKRVHSRSELEAMCVRLLPPSPKTNLGYTEEDLYPKTNLGYTEETLYPKTNLGDTEEDLYPKTNLGYTEEDLYPKSDEKLKLLMEVAKEMTADEIEFAIAFFQSLGKTPPDDESIEEKKSSKGAIELKMIGRNGPYVYRRVWDGKRHRSIYLGKVATLP